MGQHQSKDETLYQQAINGNIEAIRTLRSDGAGLEWIDKEGKTPLIAACMNPELYNVAKTLIDLGANVNAYHPAPWNCPVNHTPSLQQKWIDKEGKTPLIAACMNPELYNVAKTLIDLGANVNAYHPGRYNGTPLHHAAKRGLQQTVKLLLSHGANALQMNDYGQTPLDVARIKGHINVVRAIEEHVCLFSGWLRELFGPGFMELLAPQLLSRKVWVVILPIGSLKLQKPFKLELVIYSSAQDAQPRTIVPLWKANLEEPNFGQLDPLAIISNISRIPKRWRRKRAIKKSQEPKYTRIKLAPLHGNEKQQLQRFCNACKGIPQVKHQYFPFNNQAPSAPPSVTQPASEDAELNIAINASLQSASYESPVNTINSYSNAKSCASDASTSHTAYTRKCEVYEADPSGNPETLENSSPFSTPETPVENAATTDDGPIRYPSIDMNLTDASSPTVPVTSTSRQANGEDASPSSCTICLDAPVEGACVPCGHMAGCMSCMNEIKAKEWGCPVCRTKIDQVIRIYAV